MAGFEALKSMAKSMGIDTTPKEEVLCVGDLYNGLFYGAKFFSQVEQLAGLFVMQATKSPHGVNCVFDTNPDPRVRNDEERDKWRLTIIPSKERKQVSSFLKDKDLKGKLEAPFKPILFFERLVPNFAEVNCTVRLNDSSMRPLGQANPDRCLEAPEESHGAVSIWRIKKRS